MNIIIGIIFSISIITDQLTKYWAILRLKNYNSIKIIGNFLRFTYAENRGAAFSILQNQIWFFVIVTIVMLIVLAYIYFFTHITNLAKLSIGMIAGGALGNFIDRVRLGYVVDFIDVRFGSVYDFPVFNIADSFVVVGTILMIFLIFFNRFEKV